MGYLSCTSQSYNKAIDCFRDGRECGGKPCYLTNCFENICPSVQRRKASDTIKSIALNTREEMSTTKAKTEVGGGISSMFENFHWRKLTLRQVFVISCAIISLVIMIVYANRIQPESGYSEAESATSSREVDTVSNESTVSTKEPEVPTCPTLTCPTQTCPEEVLMDHPMVISYLRSNYLIPPPARDAPYYNLDPTPRDTSIGQSSIINRILRNTRDGFFIECGAHNGVESSTTLLFELGLNWTGLLIEPNPESFKDLAAVGRKAYLSPTCLSRTTSPEKVTFINQGIGGHIIQHEHEFRNDTDSKDVQCFPLYSYLLALNRTTIDYFSLDVESNELDVLKTIPWDKVNIRTLSVEYFLLKEGKEALKSYMLEQGYYVDSDIQIGYTHGADDFIFVKNDALDIFKKPPPQKKND